jgi:STE24 endopeptidase
MLFSVFINNQSLYSAFGFLTEKPIIIGFLLFNDVLTPMDMVVKFLLNTVTRRFEFQADQFAKELGYATDLARSLLKLHTQNLSSVDADPFFATYHFSHPHITERLEAIGWKGEEKVKGATLLDSESVATKASGRDEL